MTLNLEQYFAIILSDNNEARNSAIEQLTQFAQDPQFSTLLLQIILNNNCSVPYRFLSLSIFLNLKVIFPPDAFSQLLLMPKIDEMAIGFVDELSILLGKNITNESQIQLLLTFPTTQPTPIQTYERLFILNVFLEFSTHAFERDIIQFCLAVISQTSNHPSNSDNIEIILKIRKLAANAIHLIISEIEELNENFFTIFASLFSFPISNALNLPVIATIFRSVRKHFELPELYNIGLSQCIELGAMSPLNSDYLNYADDLIFSLIDVFDELDVDENSIKTLLTSLISCCLLNASMIETWQADPGSFLLDYINNDEYDYNYQKSDSDEGCSSVIQIRAYVTEIIKSKAIYKAEAVEICKEIMRMSPYHMEVSFYFLSQFFDGIDIGDFPSPAEDQFILFGRYLILVSVLNYEIDGGIIDECIESDNPILLYLTSVAIIKSKNKTFTDKIPAMISKLLSMTFIFESPECQYHLLIINLLTQKSPRLLIDHLQTYSENLLHIFLIAIPYREALKLILEIFDIFISNVLETVEFLQNFLFSFIQPFFLSSVSSSNSDLMYISIDFLQTIFSHVSMCTVSFDALQPVVELFLKIISDSFMYWQSVYENKLNPLIEVPDVDVLPLERDVMDSVMKLSFFISQTPLSSSFVVWYIQALLSVNFLPGKFFNYLPSIIYRLFHSISDHNCHIELLKALLYRREHDNESLTIQYGVIVALAELIFDNREYTLNCLQELSVDIRLFLPSIASFIVNKHQPVLFDYLLIIAVMFQLGSLTVIDFEEEKPMVLVALRTFFQIFLMFFDGGEEGYSVKSHLNQQMSDQLLENQTHFLTFDEIYLNHPILSMNLGYYLEQFFPSLDSIPEPFLQKIQIILNHL